MKLWVIRHAKSSWTDRGKSDFDRPLNKRGLRDGPLMQRWLSKQSDLPKWILASDAQRTRHTSEFISAALAPSVTLIYDHRLYLPSVHIMLELIAETPMDIRSVALISHNPASTHLVNMLVGEEIIDNLPTLGIARINVEKSWGQLGEGCGSLDLLVSPKMLLPENID